MHAEQDERDERHCRQGGQGERQVRERLDDQASPHDVAQREASFKPAIQARADQPARRGCRDEQPESDLVHPQSIPHIEHEHRPGRSEGDVEREDRQGKGSHRRMGHEPADPLGHLGSQAGPRPDFAFRARDDPRDEECTEGEGRRVRRERKGHARCEQERTDRRGHELVGQQESALESRIGDPEVVAGNEARKQRARGGIGEGLGRAEDEERCKHHANVHGAADDRRDQCDQDDRPTQVRDDHEPPAVDAVRDDTAEHPEQEDG